MSVQLNILKGLGVSLISKFLNHNLKFIKHFIKNRPPLNLEVDECFSSFNLYHKVKLGITYRHIMLFVVSNKQNYKYKQSKFKN